MTNKTISVLFIMAVLMTSATVASVDLIPNAEALKSNGNRLTQYGSVNSVVCGDRLCSEVESKSSMTSSKKQPTLSNTNLPLDIPLTRGYVNGEEVFYISTEASVEEVANHLTDLTGFRVAYTPALEATPEEALAQIYAFTNGVKGNGAFGFQPQVADSQPGDDKYSPLWNVNAVIWSEDSEPRELKSEMDILKAQSRGELSIEEAGVIVNCPFVKWYGGQLQLRDNSHVTDADSYGGGQVLDIDLENMKVTFVAHRGFAPNGDTIYYIATDASSKDVADALGVIYVPRIQVTITTSSSSDLYVFTNGLEGNGPLGFQTSIGSTTVGDKFYSPLWRIQTATWDNPDSADFLKTISEISQAASKGKLETGLAGFVVNCPFVEVDSKMDKMMMKDDHMMKDKMKDKMIDKKSMMMEKMSDIDSTTRGDLTAPSGDAPFGGKTVGTFSILVDGSDHVNVTTDIKNVSSGMVLEGWLVDMDTGYKLSLGKSHDNGKLSFSQQMVNPWIYDAIVMTEEPIGDSNPAPNVPVGGVLLETPFGL